MKIVTLRIFGTLTISAILASCGGGGESTEIGAASAIPDGDLLTGVFSDSPVAGLSYTTPTVSGVTDADGLFTYRDGETVVFSIGNLALPEVVGAGFVTPLDMVESNFCF